MISWKYHDDIILLSQDDSGIRTVIRGSQARDSYVVHMDLSLKMFFVALQKAMGCLIVGDPMGSEKILWKVIKRDDMGHPKDSLDLVVFRHPVLKNMMELKSMTG